MYAAQFPTIDCSPPATILPLTLPPADRTKRVKDARSEAQKEIEEYRNQKESEFKTFEKEVHR